MEEDRFNPEEPLTNSKSLLKELEQNEKLFFAKNTPTIIAIIIVTIGFTSLLWYSFKNNDIHNSKDIPLIKADNEPVKIKPLDPGGMVVPNMDKTVYNNLITKKNDNLPKVERILPSPEEPIDKSNIINNTEEDKPDEVAKAPQENPDSTNNQKPSSEILANSSINENAEDTNHFIKKEAESINNSNEIKEEQTYIKPFPSNQKNKLSNIKNDSKKNKIPPYRVQLASFKTEKEALTEWKKIKVSYSSLLSKLEPYIAQKKIASKGVYYRLQAGPISGESDARLLCKKLSKLNQACIVVKE
ncbi:MAG: SPOR domain-containing protein [Alphaproteobacteria bacterium]